MHNAIELLKDWWAAIISSVGSIGFVIFPVSMDLIGTDECKDWSSCFSWLNTFGGYLTLGSFLLLILGQIASARKNLKGVEIEKTLENERSKFTSYKEEKEHELGEHKANIDSLFKIQLKKIARELNLSVDGRITVYCEQAGKLVRQCRVSDNPNHAKDGRVFLPINEGVVGAAWARGIASISAVPEYKRKGTAYHQYFKQQGLEISYSKNKMVARSILAVRLQRIAHEPLAVMVIESEKANPIDQGFVEKYIDSEDGQDLVEFVERNKKWLPDVAELDELEGD